MKAALAALLWLGAASGAHAAVPPELCAPEVELRSTQLEYRGQAGLWFDAEVARCLLVEVKGSRAQQALLADFEVRYELQLGLQTLTLRQRDLAVEEATLARAGMGTAIKLQGEAERKLSSPGRSRGLWFAIGLVSGVALVALSAYALSATQR